MLGLFIVVSKVEQQLLPNTAGKRSYMAPILVLSATCIKKPLPEILEYNI